MTEDMAYQPPQPPGGDDSQTSNVAPVTDDDSQTSNVAPVTDDDSQTAHVEPPVTDDTTDEGGSQLVGDVTEPEGPGHPEDFADFTAEELEDELGIFHDRGKAHDRAAWENRIRTFPRVRALKDKCGGPKFEAICWKRLQLNKTYAAWIVSRLYNDKSKDKVQAIWNRVIAEADAAEARGDPYDFPKVKTMLNWYKPPGTPDIGDNDPRKKGTIIQSELRFKSQYEAARDALTRERVARTTLARDHDTVSAELADTRKILHSVTRIAPQREARS